MTVEPGRAGLTATQLLDGRNVDLSRPLTVPALDAVMVVIARWQH